MNDKGYTIVETLAEIGREHQVTIAQTAVTWLLANPTITSAIIGAYTVEQLSQVIQAMKVSLSPEEKARLDGLPSPT